MNRIAVGLAISLLVGSASRAAAVDPERLIDLTAQWDVPASRTVLGGFHNLYNANVIAVPDAEWPWRMWFFGWAAADSNPTSDGGHLGDAIYHARSRDLRSFEVYAGKTPGGEPIWDATQDAAAWVPVIKGGDTIWDNMAQGDPSVVLRNGVYHMALSSVGWETIIGPPPHIYTTGCVMAATSTDGIHWTKSAAPILIWADEWTNRWDRPTGTEPPPPGFMGSYHRPSLMWFNRRWRCWFDYYLEGTFLSMGYAECAGDFMNPDDWSVIRANEQPLLRDWPNPCVTRVDNGFLCFSDAPWFPPQYGGDGRLTTVAGSPDGLDWTVLGHLRPEGMGVSHVPQTTHVNRDGRHWLYLFYAWKPELPPGSPWDYRYKEVRYMRLDLGEPTAAKHWRLTTDAP